MGLGADYSAFVRDLFAPVGPISIKRMFGGAGVFTQGVMFALIADEQIYLKVDEENEAIFLEAGCEAFTYTTKKGVKGVMSFRLMPDECYDDPDLLEGWATTAIEAAFRNDAKKPKSKQKRR